MITHLEIVNTADGSQTILDKTRDTTYHSINGAVTESNHVFIEAGLKHLVSMGIKRFRIFEMGFGTGLNAFLTYIEALKSGLEVNYHGVDSHLLPHSITEQLVYPEYLDEGDKNEVFRKMHSSNALVEEHFTLQVYHGNVENLSIPAHNNLIYYDAFGPTDQSELWEFDILSKVVSSMAPNGILVTYCAQGQFKRNLKLLGCEVESLPGPPGKREIVRATLTAAIDS